MKLPEIVRNQNELRSKHQNKNIILIPTMGGLHAGHISLVNKARKLTNLDKDSIVCVSIFVNPLQFNQNEDFDNYPRQLESDLEKLKGLADTCFVPDAKIMYPHEQEIYVVAPSLDSILCGKNRPDHFRGVLTVVHKLIMLVAPKMMMFGEKDYQQLVLIKKMVEQLFLQPEIIAMPTVRDDEGLALSSRNTYLEKNQLDIARQFNQVLTNTAQKITAGVLVDDACQTAKEALTGNGFEVEYVECTTSTLEPVDINPKDFVLLAAAKLGNVRLIDNVIVSC